MRSVRACLAWNYPADCASPTVAVPHFRPPIDEFIRNRVYATGGRLTIALTSCQDHWMEGHSDGSAGPLSYIIVIWWDKKANLYHYFACFKDAGSGCEVRGEAC
jgi:hypothetical protein